MQVFIPYLFFLPCYSKGPGYIIIFFFSFSFLVILFLSLFSSLSLTMSGKLPEPANTENYQRIPFQFTEERKKKKIDTFYLKLNFFSHSFFKKRFS